MVIEINDIRRNVNGNSLVSNGKYLLTSDIQFSPRICFSMAEIEKVSKI